MINNFVPNWEHIPNEITAGYGDNAETKRKGGVGLRHTASFTLVLQILCVFSGNGKLASPRWWKKIMRSSAFRLDQRTCGTDLSKRKPKHG
jgi:hypothetical protein